MKISKVVKKLHIYGKYRFVTRAKTVFDRFFHRIVCLSAPIYVSMPDERRSVAIFAACDSEYCEMYARSFVASFSTFAEANPIHLHIFNPDTSAENLAKELTSEYSNFSWSYDDTDLTIIDSRNIGIYYYSARFIRMFDFMTVSKRPCICLDVDVLCNTSVDQFFTFLNGIDLAFHARFEKFGYDTKVLAGTLFVSNTDIGFAFIENVKNKISFLISYGLFIDKLDQIVIYDCFTVLKREAPSSKFTHLGSDIIDTQFSENSVIWYPKGKSRNDERFLKRSVEIINNSLGGRNET